MATRYAGDYFGISLTDNYGTERSQLLSYYPELRKASSSKKAERSQTVTKEVRAVGPFAGFKTLSKKGDYKAVPVFSGFKTVK